MMNDEELSYAVKDLQAAMKNLQATTKSLEFIQSQQIEILRVLKSLCLQMEENTREFGSFVPQILTTTPNYNQVLAPPSSHGFHRASPDLRVLAPQTFRSVNSTLLGDDDKAGSTSDEDHNVDADNNADGVAKEDLDDLEGFTLNDGVKNKGVYRLETKETSSPPKFSLKPVQIGYFFTDSAIFLVGSNLNHIGQEATIAVVTHRRLCSARKDPTPNGGERNANAPKLGVRGKPPPWPPPTRLRVQQHEFCGKMRRRPPAISVCDDGLELQWWLWFVVGLGLRLVVATMLIVLCVWKVGLCKSFGP